MAGSRLDAISLRPLHPIDPDETPKIQDSSDNGPHPTRDDDDDDHYHHKVEEETENEKELVPDAFSTAGVLLLGPPVLSADLSREDSRCKTSRVRRSWTMVCCLWICVGGRLLLSMFNIQDTSYGLKRWVPTILATLLASVFSHLGHGDILLDSSYDRSRDIIPLPDLIVSFVCPILSMPISGNSPVPRKYLDEPPDLSSELTGFYLYAMGVNASSPRFETVTYGPTHDIGQEYYPMYISTLSSWDQALGTAIFSPPFSPQANHPTSPRSGSPWALESWSGYSIEISTNFTLRRNGRGPDEITWNNDLLQRTAVVMPVLVNTSQPLGSTIAIATAKPEIQPNLGITLDCEYILLDRDSQIRVTDSTLEVDLVDSDHCSGTVELKERPATHNGAGLIDVLEKARTNVIKAGKDDTVLRRSLAYLDAYVDAVNVTSIPKTYTPGWRSAKGPPKTCRRKLFMAATTRAIIDVETSPGPRDIQAASCTPQYYAPSGLTKFSQYLGNRLQRQSDLFLNSTKVEFDVMQNRAYFEPQFFLADGSRQMLDDNFSRHIEALASQPSIRPSIYVHLQNELGDILWERPVQVGSLLMSSKFVRSSFLESINSAASIAQEESMLHGNSSQLYKVLRPKFVSRMYFGEYLGGFLLNFLFLVLQAITIAIVFVCNWGVWILLPFQCLHYSKIIINEYFTGSDLELPLRMRPIATTAALLRDSRIWALLRDVKDFSALGTLVSRLSFGFRSEGGPRDPGGLRIDCAARSDKKYNPKWDEKVWTEQNRLGPETFQNDSFVALAILLSAYTLLLSLQTATTFQRTLVPWRTFPVVHLLLNREQAMVKLSIWQLLYFYFFPACMAFSFSFVWWRRLYVFYCGRQPWVGLKTPQPTRYNLSLDYFSSFWPLRKAIQNRHWTIAFLTAGTLIHLAVPALLASRYTLKWHSFNPGIITANRTFIWKDKLDVDNATLKNGFDYALGDMINGLENWKGLPKWSTYTGAFLPVELENLTDNSGLWFMNTSVLSGELHCEEASVSLTVVNGPSDNKPVRVQSVRLSPSTPITSQDYVLKNPCQISELANPGDRRRDEGQLSVDAFCGRWWILESHQSSKDAVPISWGIAWLSGTARRSPEDLDMYFNSRPRALGMICKPIIKKGSGTLTLTSADNALINATLFEYSQTFEEELDSTVASQVSRGMMEAIAAPKSVYTKGAFANTPRFTGDILSFAFYRFFCLRQKSALTLSDLRRGCSGVFSTYLSALANGADMFKQPTLESVQLEPRRMEFRMDVNKWVLMILYFFIFLWAGTLYTLGRIPKAYRLPIAPEPLINRLFLISRGSLVEKIKERIPHADQLSPERLLREIETWDDKFALRAVEADGDVTYAVEAEENAWDSVAQRYRDDDTEAGMEREGCTSSAGYSDGGADGIAGEHGGSRPGEEASSSAVQQDDETHGLLERRSSDADLRLRPKPQLR